jgi:DNA-directed RNA polymerase specialized sigma subunit
MTAKEYLEQVQKLEYNIKRMKQRSEEYERMSLSVSGQNYEGVRVDRTRNLDAPFVKWIMKKCELDQEIATLESKLTNLKANILLQVESFENENYKNVIVMHYLNGETWSDIARKLYVVKRTVLRWNDAALEQIKVPA